jgi:hypothetical protein
MPQAIKVATVYRKDPFASFFACDMSLTRWLRISESVARRGYAVDIIVDAEAGLQPAPNLRFVLQRRAMGPLRSYQNALSSRLRLDRLIKHELLAD